MHSTMTVQRTFNKLNKNFQSVCKKDKPFQAISVQYNHLGICMMRRFASGCVRHLRVEVEVLQPVWRAGGAVASQPNTYCNVCSIQAGKTYTYLVALYGNAQTCPLFVLATNQCYPSSPSQKINAISLHVWNYYHCRLALRSIAKGCLVWSKLEFLIWAYNALTAALNCNSKLAIWSFNCNSNQAIWSFNCNSNIWPYALTATLMWIHEALTAILIWAHESLTATLLWAHESLTIALV